MPRIYSPQNLQAGVAVALDAAAARHVQVLRLQPGDPLTLFNGQGGEYAAQVVQMGRSQVQVQVGAHSNPMRELPCDVHLALGVPANDRMEWLVEKATELGVASIQPLMTQRSVLRLSGDRALKKVSHWQAIAAAACEQCGRNRLPLVHPVQNLSQWLAQRSQNSHNAQNTQNGVQTTKLSAWQTGSENREVGKTQAGQDVYYLLSLQTNSIPLAALRIQQPPHTRLHFLSGPEGGLSQAEEQLASAQGYNPLSLGARILRAETAPLAVLAMLGVV